VKNAPLAGCSILVLDEQPFVALCLQILLEGAGAEVHSATHAGEALHLIDRKDFSAAVLDCSKGSKGLQGVAQQLVRFGLPFVVCKNVGWHDDAWPGTPVLIKPVIGFQLIEVLCRLIQADSEALPSAKSSSTVARQAAAVRI
jgi:CheY-like chemotaxis protein